jgi:excisionase family DNA binding protein
MAETMTPTEALAAEGALTIRDLARFLGVSERHAYRIVERGDVRSARAGRRVLIPRRAARDYLARLLAAGEDGEAEASG